MRQAIGAIHGLPLVKVLPGNGAAELFTWAARDAAAAGLSGLLAPGFADYRRALQCWRRHGGDAIGVALGSCGPIAPPSARGFCGVDLHPHNPTGQLWSRASLEAMLIAMP